MTNPNPKELAEELARIKTRILEERSAVADLAELLRRPVEREAGIWEFGFDELEAEMWRRFAQLEEHQDCSSEVDEALPPGRVRAALTRRLKNLYRTMTGPLSRAIMDRRKQFNLDRQNLLNRESVPFHLAILLTLQRLKDRLNVLEEHVDRLRGEQDEAYREMQRLGKRKTENPGERS